MSDQIKKQLEFVDWLKSNGIYEKFDTAETMQKAHKVFTILQVTNEALKEGMARISVDDRLPEHELAASEDVLWMVIKDDEIIARGIGNVGMLGGWYGDCVPLSWNPTHWMQLPG